MNFFKAFQTCTLNISFYEFFVPLNFKKKIRSEEGKAKQEQKSF